MKCVLLWIMFGIAINLPCHAEHAKSSIISLSCVGAGSSLSIARKVAIDSCKTDVANFLPKTTAVKTLSIESEKAVALHASVEETSVVKNLTCTPENEEIKQFADWFRVKLRC